MRTMRNFFILQMFPESLPHAGHRARGWGRLRVPGAHTDSGTTGLKVTGLTEVRAGTQEHILIHPQIFATTVPQQINTTTTQVQGVHDKKARRPSRKTQRRYILCIAKEQARLLNNQNQGWANQQCKYCWALPWSKRNLCSEKLNMYTS